MAQQDDGAERSHEPTQKRLDQALKEGQVLTSKETMVFATMVAATLAVMALPLVGPATMAEWTSKLRLGPAETLDAALLPGLVAAGKMVLLLSLVVAVPVILAAIATQAATGGLHWSPKGFAFKPEKLDPLKGLGRMVSMTALVELGKAVAKVSLLLGVAAGVIWQAVPELVSLGTMTPGDASRVLMALVIRLFAGMVLALAVIAVIDLSWTTHTHRKGLRMTFDEVKRENREDNGAPEVKGRLRRMQMEASRRGARERAALPNVPEASVVITNPSHFAVALRYRTGQDDAPVIIATGRDVMAVQVIERARKSGVRILRLPPLARALYFTGDIGQSIHPGLFAAVAAVLAHVWRLDKGQPDPTPDPDLPPDMRFDANGHLST